MKKIFFIFLIFFLAVFVFLLSLPPFFAEKEFSLLDEIKKRGKIVVGTEPLFPPFEFYNEKGELVGFDIDLAKEIAKQLGVELELKTLSFEKLFSALILTKEIDIIISAISVTPERTKFVAFSIPYFGSGEVFLIKKGLSVEKLEEMKNKKIGVQTGTISEVEAKKFSKPENIILFKNYQIAIESLLKDEIDAVLVEYPLAKFLVKENPKLNIIPYNISSNFYAIGLRKGEDKFLFEINQIIQKLKRSGYFKILEEKWLKD
jgi:ABC-type amino acid transport substrate-binding protein